MNLEILTASTVHMGGLISKLKKTDNSTLPSITKCKDGYSWWASFEFYPLATGKSKTAFEAMMYIPNDFWSKTRSVVKVCNGGTGKEDLLRPEIRTSEIADDYWNKFRKFQFDCPVPKLEIVRPLLAALDCVSILNPVYRFFKQYDKRLEEGEFVLLEPYIEGEFTSFIYSYGVVSSSCPDFLQAFCHFSYFESNGEFVISNLQGTSSEKKIVLSSPCIHSRDRSFGERDMGEKGMLDFFTHHRCSSICANWPKPISDGAVVCPSAPCDHKCSSSENIETLRVTMQPPSYWEIHGSSEVSKDQLAVHTSCMKVT